MRPLALLSLGLLAFAATAQPADTLDWRRYYPLAVGNVWEYHDAEAYGDQFRYTIVSDAAVGGQTYYRQRLDRATAVSGPGGPDTLRSTSYGFLRYDEGGVVGVPSVEADTVRLRPCEGNFQRDLRLGFGARVACDPPPEWFPEADSVLVYGEYDREWAPSALPGTGSNSAVAVAAVKSYAVGGFWFSTFVADVGPVRAGNLWGPTLHYASVGGVEYGAPGFAVSVGSESPAPEGPGMDVRVLGNPSAQGVGFEARAPSARRVRFVVYDALGRAAWSSDVALSSSWTRIAVPPGALASGSYVLVAIGAGVRSVTPFTVAR